jgi:hypothetical protein
MKPKKPAIAVGKIESLVSTLTPNGQKIETVRKTGDCPFAVYLCPHDRDKPIAPASARLFGDFSLSAR